jgi:hypothetical protein
MLSALGRTGADRRTAPPRPAGCARPPGSHHPPPPGRDGLGEAGQISVKRDEAEGPADNATAFLAAGGFLAGAGTAICGGRSTGHGLSGCARLQPAGLAATVVFFGTAVAVSFLIAGVRG